MPLMAALEALRDNLFCDGTHFPHVIGDRRPPAILARRTSPPKPDIRRSRGMATLNSSLQETFMLHSAILITVALVASSASSASAANGPHCAPFEKIKKDFDSKTHFTTLTPGQLNFARGGYVATPPINGKMPAGDSAMLATHDGDEGGVILWMRGRLVCEPTPVPGSFIRAMNGIRTGALDSDGNEI
jgi:hypothetical protein